MIARGLALGTALLALGADAAEAKGRADVGTPIADAIVENPSDDPVLLACEMERNVMREGIQGALGELTTAARKLKDSIAPARAAEVSEVTLDKLGQCLHAMDLAVAERGPEDPDLLKMGIGTTPKQRAEIDHQELAMCLATERVTGKIPGTSAEDCAGKAEQDRTTAGRIEQVLAWFSGLLKN